MPKRQFITAECHILNELLKGWKCTFCIKVSVSFLCVTSSSGVSEVLLGYPRKAGKELLKCCLPSSGLIEEHLLACNSKQSWKGTSLPISNGCVCFCFWTHWFIIDFSLLAFGEWLQVQLRSIISYYSSVPSCGATIAGSKKLNFRSQQEPIDSQQKSDFLVEGPVLIWARSPLGVGNSFPTSILADRFEKENIWDFLVLDCDQL